MDVSYCRRCDKVRSSPCAAVCWASNDHAAREQAILAMHEHDMRQHKLARMADNDHRIYGHEQP